MPHWGRGDIDAVTVCTPSGLPADGAVAALDAGKHVVVEKPIDITLAAADRIIDAEKRSGARLRLDTDLTVTHDDGRVETFQPAAEVTGERAYWGASHGLLIDDFYRHVRAGKHFWIDAPAALESLHVIQAAYDQCPALGR